ncbi:MAG TPA: ubiquinol-cytochrome C chaperone family protein [Xanthobacteraceae bacterium]|jgi:cytochrome b pre-mRNA-processing protein 3
MIFRWFAPTPRHLSIPSLYGAIVAQARRPAFYQLYRVPDTVTGRLEMILLHMVLVLRHCQQLDAGKRDLRGLRDLRDLGQRLFDHFCSDMDDNMREMGVGDLAVPRKMRRIGDAFYARQAVYGAALAHGTNDDLSAALARCVYRGPGATQAAARLADYSRRAAHALVGQAGFESGEIEFPDPEAIHVPAQA